MNLTSKISLLLICGLLIPGCCGNKKPEKCPAAPSFFYLNPAKDPATIGRVAVIGFVNQSTTPEIAPQISEAVYEALQKRQLFGLTLILQEDPLWTGMLFENTGEFSLEQLALMHKTFRSDAILVGTVTQYSPFPRLAIGLKLKLIDLRDGALVWALEQFWDSTDKQIEERIEDFWKCQMRKGYDPLQYKMALVSPKMFLKFVAFETALTFR